MILIIKINYYKLVLLLFYIFHPLYPPPAGDIELFPLPAGDIAICFSTGRGYRNRFSPMAVDVAVSPAGGGLRGWTTIFPLYNLQLLCLQIAACKKDEGK